jgi:hypothetical protein
LCLCETSKPQQKQWVQAVFTALVAKMVANCNPIGHLLGVKTPQNPLKPLFIP